MSKIEGLMALEAIDKVKIALGESEFTQKRLLSTRNPIQSSVIVANATKY